jgi:hypothetical protein
VEYRDLAGQGETECGWVTVPVGPVLSLANVSPGGESDG